MSYKTRNFVNIFTQFIKCQIRVCEVNFDSVTIELFCFPPNARDGKALRISLQDLKVLKRQWLKVLNFRLTEPADHKLVNKQTLIISLLMIKHKNGVTRLKTVCGIQTKTNENKYKTE